MPYLMAGLGTTYAEVNDRKPPREDLDFSAQGFNPTVGAGGGVEYFLARNFSLHADVRWLYTWNHRLEVGSRSVRGDFSNLNFFLGFRLYLIEL